MSDATTWLAFTETIIFTEQFHNLTADDTLYSIQNELLENPTLGKVIKGTNGARKARIGDAKRKIGKSGGYRYIYVYLEKAERIYLLLFYSKREQEDLTPQQAKQVGELVKRLKEAYKE